MEEPGFWEDPEKSTKIVQLAKNLKDTVKGYKDLEQQFEDIGVMIEMGNEENDPSVVPEVEEMLKEFKDKLEEMRINTLLSGEYDSDNAILRLNAGAGGTESCDWCSMLYRMYNRWAEKKGYSVEVLDYLDGRNKEKPFCLFLSWNPPHPPYDLLPEKYADRYRGKELVFRGNVPDELRSDEAFRKKFGEYYGAIEGLDDNFGRIMEYLDREGLTEDTIVVLSADHGDCMGSHGLMGKNIWYDESIRIPLYIRGPQVVKGHSDALIASQDHMPTLLELLDAAVPDTVQGKSFASLARGASMEEEPEHAFLCMIPGMPELVEEYRKLGLNNKAFGWRGIRTKDITYVVDNGTSPSETQRRLFYDNKKDPLQLNPVELDQQDAIAEAYDAVIRSYLRKTRDPFLL